MEIHGSTPIAPESGYCQLSTYNFALPVAGVFPRNLYEEKIRISRMEIES